MHFLQEVGRTREEGCRQEVRLLSPPSIRDPPGGDYIAAARAASCRLTSMARGVRGRHRSSRISLTRIEGQAIAWGLSPREGRPLVVRATHLRGQLEREKVPVSLSRQAAHARAPPPAFGESAPNAGDQAATPFRKMRGDLRAGRASAAHPTGQPSAGGFSSHHLARRGSNARARRRAWGCRSRVGTGGKGVRALRRYRARR